MKITYDKNLKLGQALKETGLVQTGGEAKVYIQEGEVLLNGEVETRRGKKLQIGDVIEFLGEKIHITP